MDAGHDEPLPSGCGGAAVGNPGERGGLDFANWSANIGKATRRLVAKI